MRKHLLPWIITVVGLLVIGAVGVHRNRARLRTWWGERARRNPAPRPLGAEPSSDVPHLYHAVRVLSIGIDEYQHRSLVPDTPCSRRDAEAVGQAFRGRYRYRSEYLLGSAAKRAAVLARLDALGKELGPDDALIIFYAGHGQVITLPDGRREGFLLPFDAKLDLRETADAALWRREALGMQHLLETVKQMRARHVLVIADACCSGFMTRRGEWSERWDLQTLATEPSRAVLAATTDRQFAVADPDRQHGYFTGALLNALDGADAASVTDVFVRVREEVVRASGRNMTPQMSFFGHGNGEFIFLPDRLPDGAVAEVMRQLKAEGKIAAGADQPLRGVVESMRRRAGLVVRLEQVIEAFEAPEYRHGDEAVTRGKEWKARFDQFEKAAAAGDANAMAALHYCHARGLGTDLNPKEALKWAWAAFETGAPVGMHVLGRAMVNGIGMTANALEGYKLIRGSAGRRSPIGLIQVGLDCIEAGDLAAARQRWEEARALGVRSAGYYLACLEVGVLPGIAILPGVTPDAQAALRHALPAAEYGLPQAQTLVAQLYANWVDPPDPARARLWIERAANGGDAQAAGWLAQALAGSAVIVDVQPLNLKLKPNPAQAFRWAQMAADQGHSEGHLALACMYEFGWNGLAPNLRKAREHADKAAAANNSGALVLLSLWHQPGNRFGPADPGQAARYALRAADCKDLRAYVWLGALYCDGSIPTDFLDSTRDRWNGKPTQKHHGLHYFTIAASRGHPGAQKAVKELADEIRKNPKAGYWQLFQQRYPDSAKEFRRLGGLQRVGV